MTHLMECSTNEFNLLSNETKIFDILKFNRAVAIGDTIIYQRQDEPEEGEQPERALIHSDELSVTINFIFEDTEGAMKKGYAAVGFGKKE